MPGLFPASFVLQRMDQKQAGFAAVPRARPSESAKGKAVGLPHLQPAAVDQAGGFLHSFKKSAKGRPTKSLTRCHPATSDKVGDFNRESLQVCGDEDSV